MVTQPGWSLRGTDYIVERDLPQSVELPLPRQAAQNDHIHEVRTILLVGESKSSAHTWVLKHLAYGLLDAL